MHHGLIVTTLGSRCRICIRLIIVQRRRRAVSHKLMVTLNRRQGAWPPTVDRYVFSLDFRQVILDCFMSTELLLELILV